MNDWKDPIQVEDGGIVLRLADGNDVRLSLAGGTLEGKVDDGCVGFTDEHGNHQTVLIEKYSTSPGTCDSCGRTVTLMGNGNCGMCQ